MNELICFCLKKKKSSNSTVQQQNEDSSSSANPGSHKSSSSLLNTNEHSNHSSDNGLFVVTTKNREKIIEKIRTKHDSNNHNNNKQQPQQNIKQKTIKSELFQPQQQILNNGFNNTDIPQFQYLFEKNQIDDETNHHHHHHNHHSYHHHQQQQMNNIETNNQFSLLSNSKNIKLPERNIKNNSIKYLQIQDHNNNNNNINNWNFNNNNNGLESSSSANQQQNNKINDNLNLLNQNFIINKFQSYIHPSSSSSSSQQQQKHYQDHNHNHQQQQQKIIQQQSQHIDQNNKNNSYSDIYTIKNNQFINNIHNILSNQANHAHNHELNKKNAQESSFIDINKPLDYSSNSTQSSSSSSLLIQNTATREHSVKQKLLNESNIIDSLLPLNKKLKHELPSSNQIKSNNHTNSTKIPTTTTTTTSAQNELDYENVNRKKPLTFEDYLNKQSPKQQNSLLNEDKNNKNQLPSLILKFENSPQSIIQINEPCDSLNQNIDNLNVNNKQNMNKLKPKPLPLKIPSTISTFQYPNMTLLKSPHFSEAKNQYTPPPMLSPFRKAPGLYASCFNTKQFQTAFSVPIGRPSGLLSTSTNSMMNIQNSISTQIVNTNEFNNNQNNIVTKDAISTGCSVKTEGFTPQLLTPKPSLLRSRSTRISSVTSSASSFFPDDVHDVDNDDKTKP